jgi:glycerol-3-phosphate acyltransferase PlsY
MYTVLWVMAGLLLGCLPFSYWVGRYLLKKDIRKYGDGNPGATNVWKAGGAIPYVLAVLLDAFKAAIPIWLAQHYFQIDGWQLALVATAPLLGNAFTPFLHFNGGTGVAVVYGAWLALTGWVGPVIMAASFGLLFIFIRETPWCVIIGMFILIAFLLVLEYPLHLVGACAGHDAIMWYKRRRNFTHWPILQNWILGHSRRRA